MKEKTTSPSLTRVAVVVPFFQQKEGILKATLESVIKQRGDLLIDVFVVDDGAPISAQEELGSLDMQADNVRIHVERQANAGPGAARNRALDRVRDEHEFIAFLDSDDEWLPTHLENATRALGYGYDFYFSDFLFPDYKEQSAFLRAGRLQVSDHVEVDQEHGIFEYKGNMVDQICVTGNIIGTSTVVIRRSAFPQQRFREAFFNGQDYLFWLDASLEKPRIAFSTNLECNYGIGVNIYSGAKWGSEQVLKRLKNELFLWNAVQKIYPLSDYQNEGLRSRLEDIRESIVRNLVHRLGHFKPIPIGIGWAIIKTEPSILVKGPFLAGKLLLTRNRE